ncbi:hypothetical protein F4776DRAFT_667603 [Hypoxylon sp. NC0597]|nr:hypothetical protein F4776DRAFT_667603 [Hypoxylon sp. NC0597]
MPHDSIPSIISSAIGAIPSLIGELVEGIGARDTPQIQGYIASRNTIDDHSISRVSLSDRNNLDEGPCGVPMYNFDMCADSLQGVTIKSLIPQPGQAQFENVPSTCMVLSTVLTGTCDKSQGSGPIPCGADCLLYTDLTDEDLNRLRDALTS